MVFNNHRLKTFLAILFCTVAITSCAKKPPQPVQAVIATNPSAQTKLAEAAVSVSQSLNKLAQIEQAQNPDIKLPAPANPAKIGMTQESSINWAGPIEPLLKKIAKDSHYRLRVLGSRPAIPVIVTVSAKHTPLAYIVRDIRFQAINQARVKVYPKQRIIELRYRHA